MTKPRLLDLYCKAGGATRGYQLAGFEVTGVDIEPQPRYCGEFFAQWDAIDFVTRWGYQYDVIHASPPCQAYSKTQRIQARMHPDLIATTRDAMPEGLPFVIENVEGARRWLIKPQSLCGTMFDLPLYRHRAFEVFGIDFQTPNHPNHTRPIAKMGRAPGPGEYMHIVGNFSDVDRARHDMGMSWATREELREAIPPAYTQYIGQQIRLALGI